MTTNKHYDNYYHFRAKTIFNCAKVQCLEHLKLKLACVHEQYGAILHKKALPWALITALCVKAWVREDQGTGLVFSPNTNVWGFLQGSMDHHMCMVMIFTLGSLISSCSCFHCYSSNVECLVSVLSPLVVLASKVFPCLCSIVSVYSVSVSGAFVFWAAFFKN